MSYRTHMVSWWRSWFGKESPSLALPLDRYLDACLEAQAHQAHGKVARGGVWEGAGQTELEAVATLRELPYPRRGRLDARLRVLLASIEARRRYYVDRYPDPQGYGSGMFTALRDHILAWARSRRVRHDSDVLG